MSISAISSLLLDSTLAAELNSASQTTSTSSTTSSTASTSTASTTSDALDTLTQDMLTLLKTLASGDVSGAQTDLAKLKTDLQSEDSSTDSSSTLSKDMTSLVKDLSSGDTTAAKTDLTAVQKDLESEETSDSSSASSSTTATATSPLDTLIAKMSESLSSGSTLGALQDLASYLVQNGQSTGTLINTTA